MREMGGRPTAALFEAIEMYRLRGTPCGGSLSFTRCEVYRVQSENAAYCIKLYPPEYSDTELSSELEFVLHLARNGISVPEYLLGGRGQRWSRLTNGWGATVYKWIDGEIHSYLTVPKAFATVRLVAAIHAASRDLELRRPDEWLWRDAMECAAQDNIPGDLSAWIRKLVSAGRPWSSKSELRACHNDYSVKNFVWPQNSRIPFVIDFTNTILAPFEWDVAGLCADLYLTSNRTCNGRQLLDRIIDHYSAFGSTLNPELLHRFIQIAIVQRALFRVHVNVGRRRQLIWDQVRAIQAGFKSG